jgi:hypothetical protein
MRPEAWEANPSAVIPKRGCVRRSVWLDLWSMVTSKKYLSFIVFSLWSLGSCTETDVNVNLNPNQGTDGTSVQVNFPDTRNASDTMGVLCTVDQDCWPVSVCIDGICGRECVTNEECKTKGGLCRDWRCEEGGADAGTQSDSSTPNSDSGNPVADPGTPTPDPGPSPSDLGTPDEAPVDFGTTPTKGYGDPCMGSDECESGLCVALGAVQGFCTQECQQTQDCPVAHACYPVGGGTKICAPSDAGAPADCVNPGCLGLSLNNGLNSCVCTHACQTASDCPGVMACSYAATANGNQKLCVPVGEVCYPDPNQLNACFQFCYPETLEAGFCTATCDSTLDCPSGSPCITDQLPNGTSLKTCQ